MKRQLMFIVALIISFGSVYAQTTMPDSSFASGIWTKANSPYIIEGELIVSEGTTLTIESGVEIRFKTGENNDYSADIDVGFFNVYGKVIAIGAPGDSIRFTRNGTTGNWGILYFHEVTDSSIFKYCVFEYANYIKEISTNSYWNYYSGAISLFQASASIHNCCFRNCEGYGIQTRGAHTTIRNNLFTNNDQGIFSYHWSGGNDSIINNTICNHSDNGVYLRNNFCYFSHNKVFNNGYNGIYFKESSPTIVSNHIYNNGSSGIYFKETGGGKIYNNQISNNTYGIGSRACWGSSLIFGNVLQNNQYGIACWNSRPYILNNTIVNNSLVGFLNKSGSNATLRNNIFWNNNQTFEFESGFTISNSMIPDSTLPMGLQDGKENMFGIYPNFQDTSINDFSLTPGSAAINNGFYSMDEYQIPDFDFAGQDRIKGSRIDIGAYEFQQDIDFIRVLDPYYHRYLVSNLVDTLRWDFHGGMTGSVTLKYSIDKGETWRLINSGAANTGKYAWKIPELISDNCKWMVTSNSNPEICDTSRYCFTISPNRIPDGISLYGKLKNDYSPYHIMGKVEVPEDSILIINPGCEIKFSTASTKGEINVYGKLEAVGNRESLIAFTRDSSEGSWGNITLYSNQADTSLISYCRFEYASASHIGNHVYNGAVAVVGSILKVSHSVFTNNQLSGIDVERLYNNGSLSSYCEIRNSLFYKNKRHGIDKYWSTVKIFNSTIAYNGYEGIDGIDIATNCIIFGNLRGSIGTSYSPKIAFCLLEDKNLPSNVVDLSGNILGIYPQFLDSTNFNFHLRENSPCIDTGDPSDDFSEEPEPNGNRINMGAYGNTSEAASFNATPRIDSLSRTESSIFAHDTITIVGAFFNPTQGDGKITFNGAEALEYLQWENNEITCIVPPNPALLADIVISNNSGDESIYRDVYKYIEPQLEYVDPEFSNTTDRAIITMGGSYFGQSKNGVKVLFESTEAMSYITWTDTLIQVTCPSGLEGLVDLVFILNDTIKQLFTNSFLFTEKVVTSVCGSISGTWNQDTIYHITCPITVEYGNSLIIEEGVIVIISGNDPEDLISITNKGAFEVQGTEENPVLFGAIPGIPGKWEGLILQGGSNIQFAEIKHAMTGLLYEDGYSHVLNKSTISLSKENGIVARGADNYTNLELTNSVISENDEWGILFEAHAGSDYGGSASGKIFQNTITENGSGGILCRSTGYTPSSFGWYPTSKTATVDPEIINNSILQNGGPGISIYTRGDSDDGFRRRAYSTPIILQNIISKNFREGIFIKQGWIMSYSQPEIMNCVIWGNQGGIVQDGGTSNMQNSIIWGDTEQYVDVRKGIFEVTYSNLMNSMPGEGNISGNPLFENPSSLDFHLTEGSHCIDAGSNTGPGIDLDFAGKLRIWDGDSNGSPIVDMGVYEFNSSFPLSMDISGTDPTCYQGTGGSATATPSGGIPPYQYEWNDKAHTTDAMVQGLRADINYRVVITDAVGSSVSDSIILSEPDQIMTQITKTGDISCYGYSDGSAMVTASNGISSYSYLWDDNGNSPGSTVDGLSGNILYHVRVTDANGCSVMDSIMLPQPENIVLSLEDIVNISCFGYEDGSVECVASDGISPYSYLWDNSNETTLSRAGGLGANVYYHVEVTDANGCLETDSVMLAEPEEITVELVDSIDQFLVARVQGGMPPYSYSWDNEDESVDPIAAYNSSDRFYKVEITDANGCSAKDSVFIQSTDLFNQNISTGLRIYPNPTTDQCILEFPNPDNQKYQLRISDLTGKIIVIEEGITSNRIACSFGNLTRGTYLLELRGSKILQGIILLE